MVLRGSIRVARGPPAGRSLELYRVTPGELCEWLVDGRPSLDVSAFRLDRFRS
jgi:hypothetical protein